MKRSSVSSVSTAASSTLYVPIPFTRIVRTGLSCTVSTPAIAALWTMWVAPATSSFISSPSSTSPWWKLKFGWSRSSVPLSVSRWRLSIATISFRPTSSCASVVAMKPAPPVMTMRLPSSMPAKPTRLPLEPEAVAAPAGGQGVHGLGAPVGRLGRGRQAEAVAQPVGLGPDEQRLERRIERGEQLIDALVVGVLARRLTDEHERAARRQHLELQLEAALEPPVPLVHDVDREAVASGLLGRLDRDGDDCRLARVERVRKRRSERRRKALVGEPDLRQPV